MPAWSFVLAACLVLTAQNPPPAQPPADHAALGKALYDRGVRAYQDGHGDEMREAYTAAAREFEAAGMKAEQALALRGLTFAPAIPLAEKDALLDKALTLAVQAKSTRVEALVLHQWGDILFGTGDRDRALQHTERAAMLFERLNDTVSLARALTSLGRLFHVQGSTSVAIATYERVLALQGQNGDRLGEAQTHTAIGAVLVQTNRAKAALPHYALALEMVERNGGGVMQVNFQRAAYAMALGNAGEFARAADLMRQVIAADPASDDVASYCQSLAYDLLGMYVHWR